MIPDAGSAHPMYGCGYLNSRTINYSRFVALWPEAEDVTASSRVR